MGHILQDVRYIIAFLPYNSIAGIIFFHRDKFIPARIHHSRTTAAVPPTGVIKQLAPQLGTTAPRLSFLFLTEKKITLNAVALRVLRRGRRGPSCAWPPSAAPSARPPSFSSHCSNTTMPATPTPTPSCGPREVQCKETWSVVFTDREDFKFFFVVKKKVFFLMGFHLFL